MRQRERLLQNLKSWDRKWDDRRPVTVVGVLFVCLGLLIILAGCQSAGDGETTAVLDAPPIPEWSSGDIARLQRLWLGSLPALPASPSNAVGDDLAAAAWGEQLFFDTRLSAGGTVSCATCHRPELAFSDGRSLAQGAGQGSRNAPSLIGVAYNRWFFWDGRRDSLWAQALSPLETVHEHNSSRLEIARLVADAYAADYEALFGPLPDLSDWQRFPERASPLGDEAAQAAWAAMAADDQAVIDEIFANVGKAIAAYERQLLPTASRFDAYVEALLLGDERQAEQLLTAEELAGLQLFIGDGRCTNCHSGPLLNDPFFHNIGAPGSDPGRLQGAPLAAADPFNCYGLFSAANPDRCLALNEIVVEGAGLAGAFKTPSLRNVAETAPYMHAGQLATLAEVVAHYNEAPPAEIGRSEIQPLALSEAQMAYLEAFLRTLTGE